MLHLRIIAPPHLSDAVVKALRADGAVAHLAVLPGAAVQPPGDVILCDVAREGANAVLDHLRTLGVEHEGAIAIDESAVVLSDAAQLAAARTPGTGADAVVWEEIEHRTGQDTRLSATYLVLLIVATVIAAVGVLLDQPILIVGAMVVGPEFGPLAGLSIGLVQGRRPMVVRSATALAVGFPVAMAVTVAATWVMTAAGLVDRSMLLADRPLTDFIWRPDALSWIVGFLAGIAGMVSITSARSGALIGVLISVTTVPAAANVAVAAAYGVPHEAWGSALQLLINLAAIVAAGALTLTAQRLWWRRVRPPARPVSVAARQPRRGGARAQKAV
ncbi:DUF389 domain-containing protein [Catellatospora tritici]|uniref:DUF389 domain-containing protein n=1 Tax=Catellatospora tritici TaxID=2851566 RepID=UPI001C2D3F0B|nr:DUF389 domain-containing protein [Catellatospora tritici]MBV1856506.1 DUF389 domain-containing protein [Catellatospora tritici]